MNVARLIFVAALALVALLGGWIGVRLYWVLTTEAIAVILAVGGVLLAVVQYGSREIGERLQRAINDLTDVRSPRTAKLLLYAQRKRRYQSRARMTAVVMSVFPLMAAGLLSIEVVMKASPASANGTVALFSAAIGTAGLLLQVLASAVALRSWLDAERFENEVRQLVMREKARNEILRSEVERSPVRSSSERVPVQFSE